MSGTNGIVITENRQAFKQAAHAAEALGLREVGRWLEASGPLLKLAGVSAKASDLVHTYRVTRDVAAVSPAGIAGACYQHVRDELRRFLNSGAVDQELREIIELELRRADALILEAGKWPKRAAAPSGLAQPSLTQEGADVLLAWSKRMKAEGVSEQAREAYAKLLARVKADDPAWASITELTIDLAERVKSRFPGITRDTYEQNEAAKRLIEGAYTSHGKGHIFEPFALNTEVVKNAADGELRAATRIAAERGLGWKATMSAGELRLATVNNKGTITGWKKFADSGVLIANEEARAAAKAGEAAAGEVNGVAQATALFEFKAERGVSDLPGQQERALPRMTERLEKGLPVYVSFNVLEADGKLSTKTYLLQPPDSKARLSYYGAGTSNAFIEERAILARQGALTTNMALDISNDSMRALWNELFWTAFETLK